MTERTPRRYGQGENGKVQRLWSDKLPEDFNTEDTLMFMVDTDLQLNGAISQEMLDVLNQAGYTYQNGTIQPQAHMGERHDAGVTGQKKEVSGKSQADSSKIYLTLPPMSKEKFMSFIQELKQNGAKFEKESKQWYIDSSANSEMFGAYIRTYLTLPPMGKEKFDLVIRQLKQDGARFDVGKKQWYIDGACDKTKFYDYLPQKLQERPSVLNKLQDAKSAAASRNVTEHDNDTKQNQRENVI